jgi:hypothetical protein
MAVGMPPPLKEGASPEEQINYTNQMQAYWFALQQETNRQSQKATAESNIQKAQHDAIMNMANNMK